ATQVRRPVRPALAPLGVSEGHKQRIVVQPIRLALAKLFERGAQPAAAAGLKQLPGTGQDAVFESDDLAIIDIGRRKARSLQVAVVENAVLHQKLGTDEQRIASEGGETLVRRIAKAGGPQRQDLPPLLPGVNQGVNPGKRRRPEISNTV